MRRLGCTCKSRMWRATAGCARNTRGTNLAPSSPLSCLQHAHMHRLRCPTRPGINMPATRAHAQAQMYSQELEVDANSAVREMLRARRASTATVHEQPPSPTAEPAAQIQGMKAEAPTTKPARQGGLFREHVPRTVRMCECLDTPVHLSAFELQRINDGSTCTHSECAWCLFFPFCFFGHFKAGPGAITAQCHSLLFFAMGLECYVVGLGFQQGCSMLTRVARALQCERII